MVNKNARWAIGRLEEIVKTIASSDVMGYEITDDISSDISAFGAFILTCAGADPDQIMLNDDQGGILIGLATLFSYGYYCGVMSERSKHN